VTTPLADLPLIASGKVREMYDLAGLGGMETPPLLMVASDRISTYDVVHPTPIPDKGAVLTGLSAFWFGRTRHIVANHFVSATDDVPEDVRGRAMTVCKLRMLPVECVVRGYITGSGWKDYQATGSVSGIELPPGLLGKLAGLSYCPESALSMAASKSGRAEQASPSCPAQSQLGTVTVGAGAGPAPFYTQGKAYLAGPYEGAPFSMAIVTPALAGPFDLGTVVVRAALQVDPETARIHAVPDPLPTILQGIPLDVRSIAVRLDRDRFTLNPTSCEPLSLDGQAISVFNQPASLSQRFQVGGCRDLGFRPRLSLALGGSTKRGQHPALRAPLTMPSGGANIASAQIALPSSQLLDQAQIKAVCSSAQLAAGQCPKGAVYGHAVAMTPLLDQPLRGPVYLRRSNRRLPDLVADLNGQLHLVLQGRIDSRHGGLKASFDSLPDAPISKLVLSLNGAKRGLLVNSRDACAKTYRATASFTAQSGKLRELSPALGAKCKGQGKKRSRR